MPSPRSALVGAALLFSLTACATGAPEEDNFPTLKFNESLTADVTAAQLEEWTVQDQLPVAPAHGGAFETMTNALRAADPAPDVVIFGDSMTQQGLDPTELGHLLSDATGDEVSVFNGASSRARWGMNLLLAQYVVSLEDPPSVALMGISTRAAERDDFYTTEGAKSPFSSMVEGCDRPHSDSWGDADVARCERDHADPLFRFRAGGDQIARAQDGESAQTSLRIKEGSRLRSDGFMIHPGVSAAEAQEISDTRMERGFPGFPTVHDEAVADFGRATELLRSHGVTVLAFEIPYTPVHQANLEEAGRDYDARRQDAAQALTAPHDVQLIPVDEFGDWWGDGDSRDAIHLAPQGATKFARQLTETPGFLEEVEAGLAD
ncbi:MULTISPECIES: SGNH/GDSL hydrolase family protein [Nesterenkonia]|uniref:SGNH/GDSL hydrolase family protein n=1 Tax=Nesterenkonia TaxID=57494 RepID=UPI00105EF684|nr:MULTISPECIES: SGNH/GDSL hydrolase family protein [Nesterenkonia]